MKRHYLLLLLMICPILPIQAQKKEKTSEVEFRAKKEAYMTEQASLTKEEAAKFFPLYFELQDRKKQINGKAWKNAEKGKHPQTTEAEYEDIIDEFMHAQQESAELDKEYLKKYKAILSSQKIYQLYKAEIKFHRNMIKIMQKSDKK